MRGILESAGRGMRAALANPVLLLAPLAVALFTLLSFALPLLALFAFAYESLPPLSEATPQSVLLALLDPLEKAIRAPAVLLITLVALTILITLLFAAAGFARAGLFGVLIRADAQAPSGASRSAFRVPSSLRVFLAAGGRYGWRFFWILNLNALAVCVLLLPLLLGAVALLAGFANGHIVPGLLLLVLGLPIALAGGIAIRLVQLAVERETLARNLTVREGVTRGLRRLRETLVGSLCLFLLYMAAAMVVGGLFSAPRMLLLLAYHGSGWSLGAGAVLTVLQALAVGALDLVSTASFVSLWAEEP